MNGANAEAGAEPGAVALGVEMLGHLLDAERAALAVAMGVEIEHHPHHLGFDGIDGQPLLDPVAALFDVFGGEAQGHTRAVVEALPCVLLHGAQHVLGILAALVFVEQRDHLPHHHLGWIVAQFLCDRHQPDAVLGEAPDVHFKAEGIAEEAAEGMDDNHVEWAIVVTGPFDHALEFCAIVIHGRGAGLDIFGDDLPAVTLAIGRGLELLIGDRKIDLSLP